MCLELSGNHIAQRASQRVPKFHFRRRLLFMPDKKQKFKDAKKKYLAAIKDRSRALVKALVNRDDLEKYQSFIDKEEATRKAYYAAAEALYKSLHPASSRKQR